MASTLLSHQSSHPRMRQAGFTLIELM